jgi:hypothetical protein
MEIKQLTDRFAGSTGGAPITSGTFLPKAGEIKVKQRHGIFHSLLIPLETRFAKMTH